MRKVPAVWFAVLLSAVASSTLTAQTSIYMTVDAIPGDQTVAPHAGEFKLTGASMGMQNQISVGTATAGLGAGKATLVPVKIQMHLNALASPKFSLNLAMGTKVPSVEIRLYNSTRMFYKTVYENVFMTSVSTDASDDAVQNIEFVYSRVKWFASPDAAGLNPPVQVGCWDAVLYAKC